MVPQVRQWLRSPMLHLATAPGNPSFFLKTVNGFISVPGIMPPGGLLDELEWLLVV